MDEFLAQLAAGNPEQQQAADRARAIVQIVASLSDDLEIRQGAALYALMEAHVLNSEQATVRFGATSARIASELMRFGSIGALGARAGGSQLSANQAEALRKMLLAIVTDPRLVLIKLAAQL
ncbi:MAG TPA: HD domain-containing protein, partial [Steroidobacteraceae bacterium]|nr:HD domain-containing protein [Steroidobacteraceae bacterium]